jgi:membrane peptidoglycan carboxypeptidase
MLKKIGRIAGIMILWVFVFFTIYYFTIILQARTYTRDVVAPGIQSVSREFGIDDFTGRQIKILLAVEDPAFYEHGGMDLTTPGAGITTITQALVKRIYFKKFKSGVAKVKQTLIAVFALNPLVSKKDQLNLFVNMVDLGNVKGERVTGFREAAWEYFDKPFDSLSEDEYISLVAMIIAPKTFHLLAHPDWNSERVRRIKKLISGEYQPKGLMDLYYGNLPPEVVESGLPPLSYFES